MNCLVHKPSNSINNNNNHSFDINFASCNPEGKDYLLGIGSTLARIVCSAISGPLCGFAWGSVCSCALHYSCPVLQCTESEREREKTQLVAKFNIKSMIHFIFITNSFIRIYISSAGWTTTRF